MDRNVSHTIQRTIPCIKYKCLCHLYEIFLHLNKLKVTHFISINIIIFKYFYSYYQKWKQLT